MAQLRNVTCHMGSPATDTSEHTPP